MEIKDLIKSEMGKNAMLLALHGSDQDISNHIIKRLTTLGFKAVTGKVGSMEVHKVFAAIETAAKKNSVIDEALYRQEHSLYHAILEALLGITRGQVDLGNVLRTVGLRFAVVRGHPYSNENEGEWIAVALYGTIGAPVRGLEHEALGLGINHF